MRPIKNCQFLILEGKLTAKLIDSLYFICPSYVLSYLIACAVFRGGIFGSLGGSRYRKKFLQPIKKEKYDASYNKGKKFMEGERLKKFLQVTDAFHYGLHRPRAHPLVLQF